MSSRIRATSNRVTLAIVVLGVVAVGMTGASAAADGVDVGVTASPPGGSYPSDAVATVWVGASDTTGQRDTALAGEPITVTITDPAGDVETRSVTTGPEGSASVTYDLSGRPDGTYSVSADHAPSATTAEASFAVGTTLELTTNRFRERPVLPGEETTVAFLARSGDSAVSGLGVDISVTRDGDEVVSETTTTGSDGFATVSFTPPSSGEYDVAAEATADGRTLAASGTFRTSPVAVGIDYFDLDEAVTGSEATYAAFLRGPRGPLANADVSVQFVTRDGQAVVDRTVTTGPNGFLTVDYRAPSDPGELDVEMQTARGEQIALGSFEGEIDVESREEAAVSLSGRFSEFVVTPGGTATVEVEATDGGTPIANRPVDVFLRYGTRGAPAFSGTATTDSDGTATLSVDVPADAPDGAALSGDVFLDYQGQTYEASLYGDLSRYEIDFDNENFAPGERVEVSLEATDLRTDSPAANVPAQFDAQYATGLTGSFATGGLVTDSSGRASTTVRVPDDVAFVQGINYVTRNTDTGVFRIERPEFPDGLTVGSDSATPGGTVQVGLDQSVAPDASGIVYGATESGVPFAVPVEAGQPATLPVPDSASGDSLRLALWAADDSGQLYEDGESISLESGAGDGTNRAPDPRLAVSPPEASVGESVTFDASGSSDPDGQVVEYRWDFDSDGTRDRTTQTPTVTHAYDAAGTYRATVTVVDDDGATAFTDRELSVVSGEGSGPQPGVFLSVGGQSATAPPGGEATLTYTVSNPTPSAQNLLLEFPSPPANVSVASVEGDVSQNLLGSTPPGVITTQLSPGASATVRATVAVDDNASTGDRDLATRATISTADGTLRNTTTTTLSVSELDPLVARFGGGDDRIGNLDVLQAVNAANSGQEIGGEPVSNLDVLQLVNRANRG
jgi:PKD repeat protein